MFHSCTRINLLPNYRLPSCDPLNLLWNAIRSIAQEYSDKTWVLWYMQTYLFSVGLSTCMCAFGNVVCIFKENFKTGQTSLLRHRTKNESNKIETMLCRKTQFRKYFRVWILRLLMQFTSLTKILFNLIWLRFTEVSKDENPLTLFKV